MIRSIGYSVVEFVAYCTRCNAVVRYRSKFSRLKSLQLCVCHILSIWDGITNNWEIKPRILNNNTSLNKEKRKGKELALGYPLIYNLKHLMFSKLILDIHKIPQVKYKKNIQSTSKRKRFTEKKWRNSMENQLEIELYA